MATTRRPTTLEGKYVEREEFYDRFDRVDRELGGISQRVDDLARRVPTIDTIEAAVAKSRQTNPTLMIALVALGFTFFQLINDNVTQRFEALNSNIRQNREDLDYKTRDRITRTEANDLVERNATWNRRLSDRIEKHQLDAERGFGLLDERTVWLGKQHDKFEEFQAARDQRRDERKERAEVFLSGEINRLRDREDSDDATARHDSQRGAYESLIRRLDSLESDVRELRKSPE